ncbi:Protein Y37E11AL.3 a [Aphelenchoides avenae]|nr:Protein Y37E11AL.3 a [Aphelenchus avenae]
MKRAKIHDTTVSSKTRSTLEKSVLFDANKTTLSNNSGLLSIPITPEVLAAKLTDYCTELISHKNVDIPDLKGFNMDENRDNIAKLHELREQARKRIRHFDDGGDYNAYSKGAAIAGAKLIVTDTRATRSLSKKIAEDVGVDEDTLLYHGLPYEGCETRVASTLNNQRTEDIVESFVDYQKQLGFKLKVLNHVIEKKGGDAKSYTLPRLRVRNTTVTTDKDDKQQKKYVMKTPKQNHRINPFQYTKARTTSDR